MCTTASQMVADAAGRTRGLTPAQVEAHQYAHSARLIDLREPDELDDDGLIAGASHVPRGLLEFWADPASPSHRPELDPTVTTILICGTGGRSALAATSLQQLGYRDVARLEGGLQAWKRAGLPVAGLASWHGRVAYDPDVRHTAGHDERSAR